MIIINFILTVRVAVEGMFKNGEVVYLHDALITIF